MAGKSLDMFLPKVQTQDTRLRVQVHPELVTFLKDPESSLYCEEMDRIVDGLSAWITSSNFKISLNGLEIVALLIDRMGDNFKHHVATVLQPTVDRLGDNKDQVRESAQDVLIKIMSASSPQHVFDRMANCFTHKLWHVRQETLFLLQTTLTLYGAKTISLSKLVPVICKMLEDQSIPVREQAVVTLVEIYRHVGERVRLDIAKRDISSQKLGQIYQKMDEMRESGNMIAEPSSARDDTDFAKPVGVPKTAKRASSVSGPPRRSAGSKPPSAGIPVPQSSGIRPVRIIRPGSGTSAGACDEDLFIRSFEEAPKVHIFSSRELTDSCTKIREMLADGNNDWEKRVEALKEVRSLVIAGAMDYDDFLPQLRQMEQCFQTSAKDLRSAVVRETCITTSYLSQTLTNKFDHFAEAIFPSLLALVPNTAKVMSTAGSVCVRFIIQYTHAPRLIPILTGQMSHKAPIMRRECSEFLDQLLHTWATHPLERHIAIIQEAIRKGVADPDTDARAHCRKAFWGFADHFKEQADSLLNSLEPSRQKQLQGELSNSSSNNSLNSGGMSRSSRVSSAGSASASAAAAAAKAKSRSRSMSTDRTQDIFTRSTPSGTARRSVTQQKTPGPKPEKADSNGKPLMRSNSAVDLASRYGQTPRTPSAASRTTQNNYSSLRKKTRSSGSLTRLSLSFDENALRQGGITNTSRRIPTPEKRLSRSTIDLSSSDARSRIPRLRRPSFSAADTRPKKSSIPSSGSNASNVLSPERSRPRARIGVSQSQPSSRSGSPSSRLSYITHTTQSTAPTRTRRKSGIPRSQGASRETSPSRLYGRERRTSGSGVRGLGQAQRTGHPKPVDMSPGSDMESALEEALSRLPGRKRFESYESDDAGSETSSVCSERSYGSSYGRASEPPAVNREGTEKPPNLFPQFEQDVSDILNNLSSPSWADRKEGLLALQNILRGTRVLNRLELKKITEIFTRMFHDPHGKVFSMFLETLIDFVAVYKLDLSDWLYVLITRLINKMGADMLGSVIGKVQRCLEAVRDSFQFDLQFNTITKYIIDQTQTPNLKVKVSLLNYIHGLTLLMDPSDFSNTSDTRLAVSRIITWTTEPKSVDVRKVRCSHAAQAVLIALFNLNTPEFSMMLTHLPKTFQDGASKILHNHLRSSSTQESEPLSPRNITSPTTNPMPRYRMSPNRAAMDEMETENMNPEEIYNSIKKTSADIQNLSKLDGHYDDPKKERDCTSQDSGIQSSMHDVRGDSPDTKAAYDTTDSPRTNHRRQQQQQYNPSYYQDDNLNGYNRAALAEAVFDVENELFNEAPWKNLLGLPNKQPELPMDESDVIAEILTELSNHNEREEERKNAMLQLIKMTREGTLGVWDEHFKTILLLLLETLGDNDAHIRALSLRVLREILKYQPDRFKDYAELTILKILEAHKDPIKDVTRAAEECASTLASSINHEQCVRVLIPIIQTAEFPINLAAIKMQSKVMEIIPREALDRVLPDVIPGLITGYDNTESSVRKASVFCLVGIYIVIGEDLRPHLSSLNGSKMKLLNLYIKRALSQKGDTSSTSTSHTSSPNMYDQV